MPIRTLRDLSGTAAVSLPKDGLLQDGLIDDDGLRETAAKVERAGDRTYIVRLAGDVGDLPELTETDVVQRAAAQRLLETGQLRPQPTAD
jgi:hypothetical protein